MNIEYCCNNCGKRFKPRDYMKLDAIYASDDINVILREKKCDSCGKGIKTEDKIVKT